MKLGASLLKRGAKLSKDGLNKLTGKGNQQQKQG
jgi:hypothetical protein